MKEKTLKEKLFDFISKSPAGKKFKKQHEQSIFGINSIHGNEQFLKEFHEAMKREFEQRKKDGTI